MMLPVCACAHPSEGLGPKIHSFRIEGAKAQAESALKEQLVTESTAWWPFAPAKHLDIAAFDLDMRRLTAFYADRGYFDARVVHRRIEPRPDGAVDITVTLDEGQPTKITNVTSTGAGGAGGAGAIDEKRWAKTAAADSVEAGESADYARYDAAKAQIKALLQEDGYAYADVDGDMAVDRDRRTAAITYRLSPGPLVHLHAPLLGGEGNLPPRKILHRVSWTPGDKYTPDVLATTQGRLYDLGVFSSVRLELPPEPTADPDVAIKVSPGKLRELKLGGGLGVDRDRQEARLRIEWSFNNFLGGLRKLQLRLKPAYAVIPGITNIQRSGPIVSTDITLIQPDLADSSVTAQFVAGYDVTLTEGYAARGPRGSVGFQRAFLQDRLAVGAAYNLQYFEFYDIDTSVFSPTSTALGFGFTNPYRLAYVEEFAQIDLRNRSVALIPGGFIGLHVEEGSDLFGGQFRYTSIVPEVKFFLPFTRRVMFAWRGLGGWLHPFGGGDATDSPVTRRFRLGGPSSHRGFGFGRLSPQIADQSGVPVPVGGDGQLLLSEELRIQVTRVGGDWVSVVPFLDSGDVTTSFDELSLGRLHHAAGVALEYMSPVGVIRAGAAARLNRLSGTVTPGAALENPDPSQRFAFHVTIGEAF